MITGVDTATAYTQRNETTRDSACEIRRKRELKEIRSLVYGHRQPLLDLVEPSSPSQIQVFAQLLKEIGTIEGLLERIRPRSVTVWRP